MHCSLIGTDMVEDSDKRGVWLAIDFGKFYTY